MAFNYLIKTMYGPLKTALPLSMADLSFGMPRAEEELKRAQSRGEVVPKSPQQSTFTDDVHWDNKALKWTEGPEVTSSSDDSSNPDQSSARESKPSYSEKDPHPHSKQDPQFIELAEMGGSKGPSRTNTQGEGEEDEPEEDPEEQYFAVPGGPGVLIHNEDDADDPGAFFHPATKEPQRIIWIPVDELGLGIEQSTVNIESGVRSSTKHAEMNTKVGSERCICDC